MRPLSVTAACILSLALSVGGAMSDPWKDESGHGRYKGGRGYGYHDRGYEPREYKQEYRVGGCKVERKWEAGGEYKEEIKCDRGYRPYSGYPRY